MPTYQTSPYASWIFPDEAYHMNSRGIQPLRPLPLHNSYELLPGGGSEAQTEFDSHDRRVALERVRMNKKKEQGMLGHRNTTERSQRYERDASRSAVPNGVFHGSPMEYVTSGGLRGGRIYTKEGEEWLAKRLQQRIGEYGQLRSGNFSAGPPETIELSNFGNIDALLMIAFTSFTSGTFSSGLNDTLNQLLQAFIKAGAAMTGRQISRYAQAVSKMVQTARSYDKSNLEAQYDPSQGLEGVDVKQYRKLSAVQQTLRLIDAALREIARVVDQPVAARQQVMSTLAERLFTRQLETFDLAEYDYEGEAPAPVQLGQTPGPGRDILSGEQFQPSLGQGAPRRTYSY